MNYPWSTSAKEDKQTFDVRNHISCQSISGCKKKSKPNPTIRDGREEIYRTPYTA
jgi:hypothetical protein